MISGVSASLSALFAFGNRLNSAARNVANCNTDGYKRTDTTISQGESGLPEVEAVQSDSPGAFVEEGGLMRETSNVDLAMEMPQMVITRRGYEANLKVLKTQEEILDSVLDIFA
jgi:flagellar basal body rod protein FlgG